ncbi:MAG: hypothetical protein ISS10_02920 [Candidatus Marinimicrobia bacterium]|nr:hypothetical protein [Candidatus Neomarinimicrobiota bacterium]
MKKAPIIRGFFHTYMVLQSLLILIYITPAMVNRNIPTYSFKLFFNRQECLLYLKIRSTDILVCTKFTRLTIAGVIDSYFANLFGPEEITSSGIPLENILKFST